MTSTPTNSMAEEGLTEGDLLEFRRRCSRIIDRFGIELEGRLSKFEDRICTRLDDCLALLHQRLRDSGLPIPQKQSLPPSRPESVSHSSSLAPRGISPNSLFQDQSTASSSMAISEPARTAYSSAVMEGDNQLPHQPIEALVDDDSNLKGDGQVLYRLFEPLRESKKLKQVVHKGDSPFLSDLYNVVDEQFENICEFKSAKILIKQVENDAKCEDEKKVEGSRLNVPNTFFTLDAYQQFDEMSEIVLDEVTAGGQLGTEMDVQVMELEMFKQIYVLFREVDGFMLRVGTFAFDPGGRIANKMEIQVLNWGGGNQNRLPAECDGFLLEFEHLGKLKLSCERGVVRVEVNACNMFDDTGSCNDQGSGKTIHWDPGGCLFVTYVLFR